ncbi:MAG: 5'-nucleotidase, lipoprotein e(P4) family [Bacteroidales bacterium]|nr:5'-nucleotidase, lipoprotein e(P4) family [Bacteroidales bacterium]MCF8327031.1 5'-nucleotidase, lipoprotein e(P4) family [Bacteroidales bacterium]
MTIKHLSICIISLFLVIGCTQEKPQSEDNKSVSDTKAKELPCHPLTYAALFQQVSAEKYALEYQAYHLAKLALNQDLADESINQQRAVILDIDETVLDNSPYESMLVLQDTTYPYKWKEWLQKADARLLAGVKDFLEYTANNGVEIFYVTNRKEEFRDVTLANLKKHQIPQANTRHLIMRTKTSSKTERRSKIKEDYHISLLIGDNLNDFSQIFEEKSNESKKALIDNHKELFGSRFIILPNATYGDWEGAVYNYNYGLSEKEKHEKRMESLQGF